MPPATPAPATASEPAGAPDRNGGANPAAGGNMGGTGMRIPSDAAEVGSLAPGKTLVAALPVGLLYTTSPLGVM